MTSDDTLVAMLAAAASPRNPLFQKGKWRFETACAAHDDGSRYFSEGLSRIFGLRFCRSVKKEQNRRRGPLILAELADRCGRGNRGAKTGARRSIRRFSSGWGVSLNPRRSSLRRRLCQFVSLFGSTAIIASLPLLASFRARAEPTVLTRKMIRIIYRNPSASRPLPSKTDRDTNLEGFFWRCL
jgi:hypothetical protein